jgi:hypothetical protein
MWWCATPPGAITATLYTSPGDGALHQVVVTKTDASANAVSVTDGTFTYSLTAQNDAVTCRLNEAGAWFGVSGYDSSGTGDFEGPASAVSGNLVSFNGTSGKIGQDSGVASSGVFLSTSLLRKEVTADVTNATATMSQPDRPLGDSRAAGIYVGEMIVKCSDSTAAEGIALTSTAVRPR